MIISESSIKKLLKNFVHFENAIVLIIEDKLVAATFCSENHAFVNKFVGIHWADKIDLSKSDEFST